MVLLNGMWDSDINDTYMDILYVFLELFPIIRINKGLVHNNTCMLLKEKTFQSRNLVMSLPDVNLC